MRPSVHTLCALLLVAAPSMADSPAATTGGWDIHGGSVEWATSEVTGTFRVDEPTERTNSNAAAPQGGACLVANLVPFGIGRARCSTHADCNGPDAIDKQHDPGLAEYSGYCVARDGSDEALTCWTRPGPAGSHCNRTIDGWEMAGGIHRLGPVNGDPLGRGEPYPEWAVYACMAYLGHDRACGEPLNPNRRVSLSPNEMGSE